PGGDYWKQWEHLVDMLVKRKLISPEDLALFKVTDSVDEAIAEILDFYRVYHSMRYVGRDLVFRLQHPLSDKMLERIRHEFKDILSSGTFEPVTALPEEANDPHIAALPRLRFHFDRRSLGRLRMMINTINHDTV